MKLVTQRWHWCLFTALIFILSCVTPARKTAKDGYFSYAGTLQKEFAKLDNYVCKVYAAADYVTYSIPADSQITKNNIGQIDFSDYQKDLKTESSMGTATLLQQDDNMRVFLSCYHIFNYPDTVMDFYRRKDGTKTPFIAHISIKENQIQFLKKYNNTQLAELVAHDKKQDIAFLKAIPENDMLSNRFGRLKTSSGNQMRTGAEVFITGYPNGYKMVTRGLMSKPFTEQPDKVIIDASFNKGYSGAPYFILSPGCNCFKLAGMITSAASIDENMLVPEFQSHQKIYDPRRPYREEVYVKLKERIKYGLTYTNSIQIIKDFYLNNQQLLNDNGVNLDDFFNVNE